MPKEVELADGSKMNVWEETEVNDLKTAAEKATEFQSQVDLFRKELGINEQDSLEEKLQEMKDLQNPNYSKFRKKFTAMEKELKTAGKEFDDDGNVIVGNKPISMDEIKRLTEESTMKALENNRREGLLASIPQESRDTVKHYLEKLEVTGGGLEENFSIAVAKAIPGYSQDKVRQSMNNVGGGNPRIQSDAPKNFAETEEGKALMSQIIPTANKPKPKA